MKDKGKAVAVSNSSSSSNWFSDYCSTSDLPCRKHPNSSSVGICAYCLKDRLIKLVCSDCGEQRLSSCSCSDISSSYRNSCTVDIGSVGRISFLMENDKDDVSYSHSHTHTKSRSELISEATGVLKRCNSTTTTAVDVKKGRFWRFGRFFKKNREKDLEILNKNFGGDDEKGDELWTVENRSVPRSKSLCGFRGDFDDSDGSFAVSIGRLSELSKDGHADSEKRSGGFIANESLKPGVKGGNIGGIKKNGPPRISETGSQGVKKGDFIEFDKSFIGDNDPGFIDLKLGLSSESKPEFTCLERADFLDCKSGYRVSKDGDLLGFKSQSFDYLRGDSMSSNGSSCRITVNSNETKKCKKSFKVWKWIVKHNSSTAGRPSIKKDEEYEFKF